MHGIHVCEVIVSNRNAAFICTLASGKACRSRMTDLSRDSSEILQCDTANLC
jgi:hypothetical protein